MTQAAGDESSGGPTGPTGGIQFDEIGYWTEIKLEIVKKYAQAYSTILAEKNLSHVYIDGFAGPGLHLAKKTGQVVPGSPLNALDVKPRFDEYYLIDLAGDRAAQLRDLVGERPNVHIFHGDCNEILLEKVFPNVRYEDYRRGLCLLDPYGLHLDWQVIETAGKMGTIDLFLNFPIMDMNRNALWRCPSRVPASGIRRMTAFWGDESWRDAAYRESPQLALFGEPPP
jgi:three-Cys-motif partner protein